MGDVVSLDAARAARTVRRTIYAAIAALLLGAAVLVARKRGA